MLVFLTIACLITHSHGGFLDNLSPNKRNSTTQYEEIHVTASGGQAAVCPAGYKYVEGKCIDEDSRCPTGFREENNACVPITSPPIVCPYGESFINGKCQAESICPFGFRIENGVCVPITSPPIVCPYGQKYIAGKCQPEGGVICPPGFKVFHRICVLDKEHEVVPNPGLINCAPGFNAYNSLCYPQTQQFNNFNCNPFHLLNGGHCQQPAINYNPCGVSCYGGYSGIFGYRK